MRNKRGQLFALYLVFITLFMMGAVIVLYHAQSKNVRVALISPMAVLRVRDNLTLFEMGERGLIKDSLDEANGDFCSEGFAKSFDKIFIDKVAGDKSMVNFVFRNLTLNGQKINPDAKSASRAFFENVLYRKGLTQCENGGRFFTRAKIGKSYILRARKKKKSKIDFPVRFNFEFERKYLITKEGGGFEVKVV